MDWNKKTILLIGGTGSFGQKFTEIILKRYQPKTIRIFSRDEFKQWEMKKRFNDEEHLRFFIGNVRDKARLKRVMVGADIIVHAAALKQILAIEYNPLEAIKTNIIGTANVIDAAIDSNIQKVVLISSDKAVKPVNLYGATKLCAEKLFVQANSYASKRETKFSCVRYGNAVGSRGSVISLFLEQKKKGILTITDKEMTRFWITLEEGVNLVINCIEKMKGGEVFVPKIPSMRIIDLARVIAPKAKIKIIGIRPGEKLHEVLLSSEEARHSKEFDKYFVIEPEFQFWNKDYLIEGKPVLDGFIYSSNTNKEWFTKEQMRKTLKNLEIEK